MTPCSALAPCSTIDQLRKQYSDYNIYQVYYVHYEVLRYIIVTKFNEAQSSNYKKKIK